MIIFKGMERRTTKMNITFSVESGVPNTVFKFYPQKISYRLNEIGKNGLWLIFPYLGVLGPIISKNNRVETWVQPHQSC